MECLLSVFWKNIWLGCYGTELCHGSPVLTWWIPRTKAASKAGIISIPWHHYVLGWVDPPKQSQSRYSALWSQIFMIRSFMTRAVVIHYDKEKNEMPPIETAMLSWPIGLQCLFFLHWHSMSIWKVPVGARLICWLASGSIMDRGCLSCGSSNQCRLSECHSRLLGNNRVRLSGE